MPVFGVVVALAACEVADISGVTVLATESAISGGHTTRFTAPAFRHVGSWAALPFG